MPKIKTSPKANKATRDSQSATPSAKGTHGSIQRWVLLGLCLLCAGGGTWALLEFVVWNNLPSELVGKWDVVEGPPAYQEGVFEFARSGKMVGHLNDNGNLRVMHAEAQVEENKLVITTRHPVTGARHVSVQTIRTMNNRELVVADEQGGIIKMVRQP